MLVGTKDSEVKFDKTIINDEPVYKQLHQSDVLTLLNDPEVRYMRFLLGPRYENKVTRILIYDKKTQKYWFEEPGSKRNVTKQ